MAARSLVGKFSKLIALLMPQWQEDQSSLIFSHYAGSLIGALDLFVRRAGYFSMLCSFRNVEQAMSFCGGDQVNTDEGRKATCLLRIYGRLNPRLRKAR